MNSYDTLFINQLTTSAAVGILPWERDHRQDVLIDVEIVIDANAAAATDEIENAVDYAAVRESIHEFAKTHRFNLLETFASKLTESLMKDFKLEGIRLSITKPAIFKDAKGVGVCVERSRSNL